MAATIKVAVPQQAVPFGNLRGRVVELSFAATDYATGGYAITPSSVGLNEIYGAFILGINNAATTSVYWQWNNSTGKLQAFDSNGATPAQLAEAAAAQDLSAIKVRVMLIGV